MSDDDRHDVPLALLIVAAAIWTVIAAILWAETYSAAHALRRGW